MLIKYIMHMCSFADKLTKLSMLLIQLFHSTHVWNIFLIYNTVFKTSTGIRGYVHGPLWYCILNLITISCSTYAQIFNELTYTVPIILKMATQQDNESK